MEDILRKYIRYALNEKPFNPELVVNLIQLRKASMLDDSQGAEILNEISRRIVREKGNCHTVQLFYCILLCFTLCDNLSIDLSQDADNLYINCTKFSSGRIECEMNLCCQSGGTGIILR